MKYAVSNTTQSVIAIHDDNQAAGNLHIKCTFTRPGTVAPAVSAPAKGVNGNNNSYVMY